MSVRSYLPFVAQKKIPNPFLLCTVASGRVRQPTVAGDGRTAVGEFVTSH
jgi:hypothetical protein